jgi:hypothetical protein
LDKYLVIQRQAAYATGCPQSSSPFRFPQNKSFLAIGTAGLVCLKKQWQNLYSKMIVEIKNSNSSKHMQKKKASKAMVVR